MTICTAAICDAGQSIVVASDRMLTADYLSLEFEHPDAKMESITNLCIGLSAGDALASTEIFEACSRMQQFHAPTIESIVDEVKRNYVELRKKRAEELHLLPRGLTMEEFYRGGGIQRIPAELGTFLDRSIAGSALRIEIIIAGIDSRGAHIYAIGDPGVSTCWDRLGYHAIGSGETHALLSIVGSNHYKTKSINQAVFAVYEAKRRAELASGVGDATELRIITKAGVKQVSSEELNVLQGVYDRHRRPSDTALATAIDGLPFERGCDKEGE